MSKLIKLNSLFILLMVAAIGSDKKPDELSYQKLKEAHLEKMKSYQIPEEAKTVMKNAEDAIAKQLPEPGLKVGDVAPEFELKNQDGNPIKLSEILTKGPVVLSFFRGNWCPYCNMEMTVLAKALPEIKKLGGNLIVISPQLVERNKDFHEKFPGEFEILADLDYKVIEQYKLLHDMPADLLQLYKGSFKLDVELFNGAGRTKLPIPGTVIIGADGKVVMAYANLDYKNRLEPSKILEKLASMQK